MQSYNSNQSIGKSIHGWVITWLALVMVFAGTLLWWQSMAVAQEVVGPSPGTDYHVFPVNANGAVQPRSYAWSGNSQLDGYNLVRTFKNGQNQSFVLWLNSNTGRAIVSRIGANGTSLNGTWSSFGPRRELRCSGAEVVKMGNELFLITHDSFTGRIRKFQLNDNGQVNLASMTSLPGTTFNDWKDKNLFSVYYYNGTYRMLGVDTWTGKAIAYTIDGVRIAEDTWSRGWTSIDHLAIGGITYRLLYKAAGDPHKAPGEANDQLARFIIQKVNDNGVSGENIYLESLAKDFSSVRFLPLTNGPGWVWHVLFFNRETKFYVVREFDKDNGVKGIKAFGQFRINDHSSHLPYVDVEPYTIGSQTFLAAMNDNDQATPFYFAAAEQMGQSIHNSYKDRVVGYQFMLAQGGRVIYSRAEGKRKLVAGDNTAPSSLDMTTRTSNGIASVSKMIMTMTALKLADNGVIRNITQDPIANYLNPVKYPAGQLHNWVKQRPVMNLLTHTSGMKETQGAICDKLADYKMDCKNFFAAEPILNCDPTGKECPRSYNDYNTNAVRILIESQTGAETAAELVIKTRSLWSDSVNLSGITCLIHKDNHLFAPCNGEGGCFSYNDQLWKQNEFTNDWSSSCSAGGWWASSRELLEFLTAIRYRKVLTSESLNTSLVSTTLEDISGNPGSTALGWNKPEEVCDGMALGKSGGTTDSQGFGPRAYIVRLPNDLDAVIVMNTISGIGVRPVLLDAYCEAASAQIP